MTSPREVLAGLRVLVVEDELLVALMVEDALTDQDCVVVGPCSRVREALQAVETANLDAAVLDINIAGEQVFPVADALDRRGVPFLLVSGYGQAAVPENRPFWKVCAKPFRTEDMVSMLAKQIEGRIERTTV